ncbi:MAG: exodeoxyribonuclease VII large subunit [Candidatus Thiodiazotropha sp. (ex Epidulcina cf. delphinae)]|nr:exodeoxyribonuclease VII large subunit [Candidatus Thiodiazotropha sp. (ex Epidulcina cf. delphinae)]
MNTSTLQASQREIYSVSRLVRETRAILEGSFPLIWVSGELSNLAQPASGHIYFSLKDEAAQVRCAMFRMKRQLLRFRPENGQQVTIRARVSLYEARGEFQLIVEQMEPAGEGALRLAFEQLKHKLATEGLFDSETKKPLPSPPNQLGIITSPTGAAVRDLLTVLRRRFPALPVIIYPVQVQGEDAPRQIIRMLQLANQRQECDLLILSRGGGSLEDLQAFNDEGLARAIHASQIPLVTGIGHEIDFTIADFVADRRAPTPSAAAELVTPDQQEWYQRVTQLARRLSQRQRQRLQQLFDKTTALEKRLSNQHPRQRLQQRAQRVDEMNQRLNRALHVRQLRFGHKLEQLQARLARHSPQQRLESVAQTARQLEERLHRTITQRLNNEGTRLTQLARDLNNLSPLNTLGRGYAIVSRESDGRVLRATNEIAIGENIRARLVKGFLVCRVVEKEGD